MLKNFSLFLTLLFLFSLDRLTKYLAVTKLPTEGVLFWPGWQLKTFYNPNLAFSLPLPGILIIGVVIIILIFLGYYFAKALKTKATAVAAALGLMIIGASSNLWDRLYLGSVVDFISFNFWPAGNLSDVYIVLGAGWLLLTFKLAKNPKID